MQNVSSFFTKANKLGSFIYQSIKSFCNIKWSEALSYAWYLLKEYKCEMVEMTKKDGSKSVRIITRNILDVVTLKGGATTNYHSKYVDIVKVARNLILGENKSVIISSANPLKILVK